MAFLEIESLSKSYTVGDRELAVLRGLELSVERGEMVAIVGASGVGKSTLLQLVGGLECLDEGTICIGDTNLSRIDAESRVIFRNKQVGFVFQFHHLLPEFTALENVAMPLRIARLSASEVKQRAEALLREVGLGNRTVHRPSMLSGGEQQRVAVARALVTRPSLLLADEPTGDLDEQTGGELQALIRRMHRDHQLTSLIATHNLRLANSCDRILRLEEGVLRMV